MLVLDGRAHHDGLCPSVQESEGDGGGAAELRVILAQDVGQGTWVSHQGMVKLQEVSCLAVMHALSF